GVALGLSGLTKFSVAFLVVGVLVAIVVSPLRQDLRTRWPWLAAVLSTGLALPGPGPGAPRHPAGPCRSAGIFPEPVPHARTRRPALAHRTGCPARLP